MSDVLRASLNNLFKVSLHLCIKRNGSHYSRDPFEAEQKEVVLRSGTICIFWVRAGKGRILKLRSVQTLKGRSDLLV